MHVTSPPRIDLPAAPRASRGRGARGRELRALVAAAVLATVAAPVAASPAAESPPTGDRRFGLNAGSHRITLLGARHFGREIRNTTIQTAPITGAPAGSEPFQAVVDLTTSSLAGIRYGYMLSQRWGLEASWSRASAEARFRSTFDREHAEAIINGSTLGVEFHAALLDRLEAHSGPYDFDVTYVDAGIIRAFPAKRRWQGELNVGLGWAFGSFDREPAIFETLRHSRIERPGELYVIANPGPDPTGGTDCPANNAPCVALRDGDGLTWHVGGGMNVLFSRNIHLRIGLRVRYVSTLSDPGDASFTTEAGLGLAFVMGGR